MNKQIPPHLLFWEQVGKLVPDGLKGRADLDVYALGKIKAPGCLYPTFAEIPHGLQAAAGEALRHFGLPFSGWEIYSLSRGMAPRPDISPGAQRQPLIEMLFNAIHQASDFYDFAEGPNAYTASIAGCVRSRLAAPVRAACHELGPNFEWYLDGYVREASAAIGLEALFARQATEIRQTDDPAAQFSLSIFEVHDSLAEVCVTFGHLIKLWVIATVFGDLAESEACYQLVHLFSQAPIVTLASDNGGRWSLLVA